MHDIHIRKMLQIIHSCSLISNCILNGSQSEEEILPIKIVDSYYCIFIASINRMFGIPATYEWWRFYDLIFSYNTHQFGIVKNCFNSLTHRIVSCTYLPVSAWSDGCVVILYIPNNLSMVQTTQSALANYVMLLSYPLKARTV